MPDVIRHPAGGGLDYRTPAEIFWDSVLHLKCESTDVGTH